MSIRVMSIAISVIVFGQLEWTCAQDDPAAPSRFSSLDHDAAWQLLPRVDPPLPGWARTLMASLPRTTAAMLELDYLHRVTNPLGSVLAGKLRWEAADAIDCEYFRRTAEADLRRAGLQDGELKKFLAHDLADLPEPERAAMAFARQLSVAAHAVTDEQVADLLASYGPEKLVAIVHTVACANFQNRIALALGSVVELNGPLPPIDLRLDEKQRLLVPSPERTSPEQSGHAAVIPASDWGTRPFADLQRALDQQRNRALRVPLPDASRLDRLPADAQQQARKILWNTVSAGYQPEMTRAWFECRRLFKEEAKLDRVFANSVFWVVTRDNQCFY